MTANRFSLRRDFLKLLTALPYTLALPPSTFKLRPPTGSAAANVLIVIFDAWSARNTSLYGYGRGTTPNIDRLSERAIIYRNHHASANFTTPGAASILTGTYPWTHKALSPRGRMSAFFEQHNIFSVFPDHYRFAYTQNSWAQDLLLAMAAGLDALPNVIDLYLRAPLVERIFAADADTASVAASRFFMPKERFGYSLLLSNLLHALPSPPDSQGVTALFPRGLPSRNDGVSAFTIETAVDWLMREINGLGRPFLSYIHLLPPHAPYCTRVEFVDRFKGDGFLPAAKPIHSLAVLPEHRDIVWQMESQRRLYDEYVLYADAEFGRLYGALQEFGALDNTWIVLTSDHGETFERGFIGHRTRTLYEPEIHVPLLIFEPGRRTGTEVTAVTSNVDLLPTLAHVTGNEPPSWTEGAIMPPFTGSAALGDRAVHAIAAPSTERGHPLTEATGTTIRWPHKLQYSFGYEQLHGANITTLHDLTQDREELNDVAGELPAVTAGLLQELKNKLTVVNETF